MSYPCDSVAVVCHARWALRLAFTYPSDSIAVSWHARWELLLIFTYLSDSVAAARLSLFKFEIHSKSQSISCPGK